VRLVLQLEKRFTLIPLIFNVYNSRQTLRARRVSTVRVHEFKRHLFRVLVKILSVKVVVLLISLTRRHAPSVIPALVCGRLGLLALSSPDSSHPSLLVMVLYCVHWV